MRRFANRQRVGKWQRRHSASGCYWQFLRRPLKFACRFASTVITVASSEGNLKEAAVIETSRIAKVRSVSASLWIAPRVEQRLDKAVRRVVGAGRLALVPFCSAACEAKIGVLPSSPSCG